MEDNFDLNQNVEQEPILRTDDARRTEQAILNAEPTRTVRRRKRKQQMPKWQYMLWKYWPPIRFGLIILAGILLIWLLGSCVAGAFAPDPTEPSEDPTVVTTEPTEPPTTEPTEPPTTDPFANMVDESWYENVLFIGDSRTMGLRDYVRTGNAEYFCSTSLSVFNYESATAKDTGFDRQTLAELLAVNTYDKIFLNLGINEAGYPVSSLVGSYSDMVDMIRQAQPDATIILQGILNVTKNYADDREYFSPTSINKINDEIRALSNNRDIYYIDINAYFSDADGYLDPALSSDGCHLTEAAYQEWMTYISVDVGDLGIQ